MGSHTVCVRLEDIDNSGESAWLDSCGFELDQFTRSLTTVSVGPEVATIQEALVLAQHNKSS